MSPKTQSRFCRTTLLKLEGLIKAYGLFYRGNTTELCLQKQ